MDAQTLASGAVPPGAAASDPSPERAGQRPRGAGGKPDSSGEAAWVWPRQSASGCACHTHSLDMTSFEGLTEDVPNALKPLLMQIEGLTAQIRSCDREIEQIGRTGYLETKVLQ